MRTSTRARRRALKTFKTDSKQLEMKMKMLFTRMKIGMKIQIKNATKMNVKNIGRKINKFLFKTFPEPKVRTRWMTKSKKYSRIDRQGKEFGNFWKVGEKPEIGGRPERSKE